MVLSQTIYSLYWKRNIQLRTPNEDIIKLFLLSARERGDSLKDYHINSNVSTGYNVEKFIEGEKLPMCYQIN